MIVAVVVLWSVAQQAPDPSTTPLPGDDAVRLEDKAFKAIENEKWCLAMRLFEAAHQKGPAAGLLENAVRAAEFANDFGSALRFADEINAIASAPKPQKAAAKKKAQELAKKIAKGGPGTQCATLDELAPPPAPTSTAQPTTTTTTTTPTEAPPPPPADLRPFALVGAGIGGGVVLIGAATAGVGLVPWFAHASAIEKINAAEGDKGDAEGLQQEQAAARAGWESYGSALTVAGAVVSGIGVAVVVGGLGYGLFGPDPTASEGP